MIITVNCNVNNVDFFKLLIWVVLRTAEWIEEDEKRVFEAISKSSEYLNKLLTIYLRIVL